MDPYLPWWVSGLLLAGVGVWHLLSSGTLLGGSGALVALVRAKDELAAEQSEANALGDSERFEAALMAATLAEFGPATAAPAPDEEAAAVVSVAPRVRVSTYVTFVLALALGGAIGTLITGAAHRLPLAEGVTSLYGSEGLAKGMLVFGGVLVGFGTRMAGGCTFGHGITGCARLQPGSILATACFFATGVAVTSILVSL